MRTLREGVPKARPAVHALAAGRSRRWWKLALVATIVMWASTLGMAATHAALLDPLTLTKFVDPLPIPGPMPQAAPNYYEIGAWQVQQRLHRDLPLTTVYGYGPTQEAAGYPGATIEARKGVPIDIHWTNHLPHDYLLQFAMDPTLDHAITTTGVPIVAHVHGAEVEPGSDGGPLTWFTPGFAETGSDFKHPVNHYANTQLPATIWYHDHAFGYTRLNVYAGLAGFYLIRDPASEPVGLPSGAYEIPLAIQDRMFTTDGQLWYPNVGDNPEHPVWTPEFFGNVILVNGKIWPYLNVEPRKYRFRILDGSNARFYSLALANRVTSAPGPAFHQIGSDGGYLSVPVTLNDPADPRSPRLLLAPGERADVIIDFSGYAPGTELMLRNNAKAPYPTGDAPGAQTTSQIMLFRVVNSTGPDFSVLPTTLTPVTRLANPTVTRTLTLNEVEGEEGPLGALLNGTPFLSGVTENPTLGTTEVWEVVNMTADTHPIHLHLVQFQLLSREKFHLKQYEDAFYQANPEIPTDHYVPVPVDPYLFGKPTPPDPNESGWKDTFRMNPKEVTRIIVRWAPQDGSPAFAFDATAAPGYVWHCHILEHEENDMMHRYILSAPSLLAQSHASEGVEANRTTDWLRISPNPAAAAGTEIRFALPIAGPLSLELFSVAGQRVRRIAGGVFDAGEHRVRWDGNDDAGRTLRSGMYFLRVSTAGGTYTKKLVVTP